MTEAEHATVRRKYGELDYHSSIAPLIYFMTRTRNNICHATTKLLKFCNDPGEALIWVMGYI